MQCLQDTASNTMRCNSDKSSFLIAYQSDPTNVSRAFSVSNSDNRQFTCSTSDIDVTLPMTIIGRRDFAFPVVILAEFVVIRDRKAKTR